VLKNKNRNKILHSIVM